MDSFDSVKLVKDYERLRAEILLENCGHELGRIILLRQGMFRWCLDWEKQLSTKEYTTHLAEPLDVIRREDSEPLVQVIVNMVSNLYYGGYQYA